jgi:hypothetical protein
MKKPLQILLLTLVTLLSASALACTKAQPNGSAGNADNPATGYITAIATNNGPNLTVTFAGSVQTTVSFYSTNVSITGSWSGTKITALFFSNNADNFATWNINGVAGVLTFHGIQIIGSGRTYSGTGGGLTGFGGLGLGQESFYLDGIKDGLSVHDVHRTVSPPGCIFATDLDLGAVGLALMPEEKMRREWWML